MPVAPAHLALSIIMSRAALITLIDHVLMQVGGVTTVNDFAALVNDQLSAQWFLDSCRIAAAQPPPPVNAAPPAPPVIVELNVTLRVAAPPPPPPRPPTTVAVPTTTVGTTTNSCRVREAQSQTAQWYNRYGTATAVQTDTTLLSMVDGATTTEGTVGMVDASTNPTLLGLVHSVVQTDVVGPVVAAADHEQLGAELAAAVEANSTATMHGAVDQVVQTEGDFVPAMVSEQAAADLEALSYAAGYAADAADASEARAAADRKAAAEDRAAAAADRAAVEHALAQNDGLMDLLRARVRSAEGRSSERVSDC